MVRAPTNCSEAISSISNTGSSICSTAIGPCALIWRPPYSRADCVRRQAGFADSTRRFNHKIAYSVAEVHAMRGVAQASMGKSTVPGVPDAGPGGRCRRIMAEAMIHNSLPQLLRYADRNAMAFSREPRLPYLDNELVEFCNRTSDDAFFRNGWQKYALRRAVAGLLPRPVTWRADKVGYAAPLDVWMRKQLKEWAYGHLFNRTISEVPGYDGAELRRMWEAHQAGIANNSWLAVALDQPQPVACVAV